MPNIKTYLTPAEINQMVANAEYLRDKVIIAFFKDSGVRVTELISLKVKDIDLEAGTAMIRHLKRGIKKKCPVCNHAAGARTQFCSHCGVSLALVDAEGIADRGRMITIGPELVELLREYIEPLNAPPMDPDALLIGLTRQGVYQIVRYLAASIGLDGKNITNPETRKRHYVHPHSFRDSLAVSWLEAATAEKDLEMPKALQEHLGHVRYETTMRYAKLSPEKVRAAADKVRQRRFG